MVILSERHLHRVVREYVAYFNHARPHQGLGQRIPNPPDAVACEDLEGTSRVIGYSILGGLHHDYRWVA